MRFVPVFLLFFTIICHAEVAIIVHPSNTSNIDTDAISRVFLGKAKTLADGTAVIPVGQSGDTAVADEFNTKVLGKSSSQLKAYWSQLVFTGKGTPPKEVSSDADVISLVAANPNIIGYINANAVTEKVKVIAKP